MSTTGLYPVSKKVSLNELLTPQCLDKMNGVIGLAVLMGLIEISDFTRVADAIDRIERRDIRHIDLADCVTLIDRILSTDNQEAENINDNLRHDLISTKQFIQTISYLVAKVRPNACLLINNQYL